MARVIALLGPQGPAPDVDAVLRELGIAGPVALVRAGYQERESEDIEIKDVPVTNLTLHARGVEIFKQEAGYTAAYQARQQRLRHLQAFYRTRLDGIEEAAKKISVRYVEPELLAHEEKVSVDMFRQMDNDHVERCAAVRAAFDQAWPVDRVPALAKHRREIRELMDGTQALVIGGGHVASLHNRLEMFGVLASNLDKPIIAWSAGAMALTDRIVLFHDYPPYGSDIAQVLEQGAGLVSGLVVLPDARRRINLEAKTGIQQFARRMAPATCVAMDHGARVFFEGDEIRHAKAIRLTTTGAAEPDWDGEPSRFSTPYLKGVHP